MRSNPDLSLHTQADLNIEECEKPIYSLIHNRMNQIRYSSMKIQTDTRETERERVEKDREVKRLKW